MQIQAKLFATLIRIVPDKIRERYPQSAHAGSPMDIELSEGSTLTDLVDHLGLPQEKVRVIFVNGRIRQRDYVLIAGDEVGIFPPVGGG
jgi:molybdopterin converting factor small subunit